MSTDWVVKQKALQDWVVACTGMDENKVYWANQQGKRPPQPGIAMKLSFISDNGLPWVDYRPNYITTDPLTVTADSLTGTFTSASAHGRTTGDGPFTLVGTDIPVSLATSTNYWVIVTSATTFKLADSFLNAMNNVPLSLGDDGSGTITLESTDTTLQAGAEMLVSARSLMKVVLTLECFTGTGVGLEMAQSILLRINTRRLLPSNAYILHAANIGVIDMERVRSVGGTQDLVLFEPRAFVDILLHITSEDTATDGMIEYVLTGHSWSTGFSNGFGG